MSVNLNNIAHEVISERKPSVSEIQELNAFEYTRKAKSPKLEIPKLKSARLRQACNMNYSMRAQYASTNYLAQINS